MAASISVTLPLWASVSSQWRNLVSATPSRLCAAVVPAISAAFLQAFGRATGSRCFSTLAPAASSVSKNQAEATSGSTLTVLPFRSCRPASSSDSGRSVTPLPRWVRRASLTFTSSRNSSADPSARTMARPSGSGVQLTSPPRILNAQATDAGDVMTVASALSAFNALPRLARFSACSTPA